MVEEAREQESEKAGWEVDGGSSGHLLLGSAGAVSVLTPLGDGHAVATRYEHHPLVGVQPLHGLVAPSPYIGILLTGSSRHDGGVPDPAVSPGDALLRPRGPGTASKIE
jgi:hypothetical protein